MRKVVTLELAGKKYLEFDLYDKNGNLVYKTGDLLTPGLLMKFSYIDLFKKETDQIVVIDNYEEPDQVVPENSLIKEQTARTLLKNSKSIIQKVYQGEEIDTKDCIDIRDTIIDEASSNLEKIECLSQLRVFDSYTFSHAINVSTMSAALGVYLKLEEYQIEELTMGALLHDIGKMRIPKEILNKPGKLEPEEFDIIKTHTTLGYNYIKQNLDVSEEVARVANDHQERFEGGGYPYGIQKQEITLYGQITAIVDVYDALVSDRVYKKGMSNAEAIRIMLSMGGKNFNPSMLYKFVYLANHKNRNSIIEE